MSNIEVISPFPVEELPRVWMWMQDAGPGLRMDIGPQTMDEFVDYWASEADKGTTLMWGVYRDGELGGWIAYQPQSYQTGNAHCIFKKGTGRHDSFWGWKTTMPAVREVADGLFSIGVERIGMVIAEDNRAIESLIKQLGAKKEALWFDATTRNGQPLNMLQYGLYVKEL